MVEISDTGRGTPAEQLEKLFDIRLASKQETVGMSLGLPTARNIVEGYGGEIKVESEPGRGTRFGIELPIAKGQS